ncbi:TVP38/TMEM64 family protein [Telmatospirillum siberiense]|uniref:TVP38/TMEM64 family membrane protein n=1 Tax=Telmatospirillum siberiense TaxID=382514 RepID=A0A2N3Q072_9PROT|nr:VTT domain-containing protein [Telmatospirillum siberiense]PKU26057.1 SNARE associated Golgi protein [Telmatospirillum siberiense]
MSEESHEVTVAGVKLRLLVKGLTVMVTLVLLGWGLKVSGLGEMLDTHWVDSEIRGHGLAGEAIFLAIGSLVIAVGLPRQAVCFLAGYAFGLGGGTVWASLASIVGCMGCFLYARVLGRDLVMHKFAGRVRRIDEFLRDNPLTMTVLIRFLPVGSNLLTNLMAGVSSVRPWPFFAGSILGYLPQTVVFVLLGSGIQVDPVQRVSLSVLLFVASAILGVYLYKRLRHGRSLDATIDQEME